MPITVALSLWEIFESRDNIRIGEPSFSLLNGNFSISLPFYMNNAGFYDISELCVNIRIYDGSNEILEFSTQPLNIPAGRIVASNLSASVSLADALSRDRELLTTSKDLDVNVALHFRVGYVLAFNVAGKFPFKWGAPFSNLNMTYVSSNTTHVSFEVSFYNNAPFSLSGPLRVELYNLQNVSIGSVEQFLDVASNGRYQELFEISVFQASEEGKIRLFFADILISEKRWGSP
ncbi:hypothetical protein KEJ37_06495 [Candidatus Bathyarchaeota archaeon]|nr:hypothetical protein [Candidatus Bathyarchaeota archaeon]